MLQIPNRYYRLFFQIIVPLIYLILFFALNRLQFEPIIDELHYWPNSLKFSESLIPSLDLLRNYGEVNTPLPFIIFGWLEYFFKGGIFAGRLLNLLLSLVMVWMIGLIAEKRDKRSVIAAFLLLLIPHYLATSVLLYTDTIAVFFTFLGFWFYLRDRQIFSPIFNHIISSIFFTLAIASRQFMLAFSLPVAIYEFIQCWRSGNKISVRWIAPLIASATLLGWFWFFGGLTPAIAVEEREIPSIQVRNIFPEYSLYFLACMGLYFVIPEWLVFSRSANWRSLLNKKNGCIAIALLVIFLIFSPLNTTGYIFGLLNNRILQSLPNEFFQIVVLYVLAFLTSIRFSGKLNLSFFLIFMNAGVLMKGFQAWDKYALPLLIIFWYFKAIDVLDKESFTPTVSQAKLSELES